MATKTANQIPAGLLAVVGAGDLAVEQVRAALSTLPAARATFEARVSQVQADVQKRIDGFDPKSLQAQAQDVPNKAAATILQTVSKAQLQAEETYETLASRGSKLIDRISSQASTKALVDQANSTIARGKAVVTTARKATDETVTSLRGTVTVGRKQAATVAGTTKTQTQTAAKKTTTSAKKTTTTAKKGASATTTAAKGARTSAKKSASAASTAAKDAAGKVGE
jgi:heparin binding hemagglutinin HbhA